VAGGTAGVPGLVEHGCARNRDAGWGGKNESIRKVCFHPASQRRSNLDWRQDSGVDRGTGPEELRLGHGSRIHLLGHKRPNSVAAAGGHWGRLAAGLHRAGVLSADFFLLYVILPGRNGKFE